jgi:hypothetical protein
MKSTIFLLFGLAGFYTGWSQNVGIGTATPQMKLHIKGGLLLDSTNGTTPVSGAGTRMMWIPAKAAFRTGIINGTEWNDANIGLYSIAFGNGPIANGFSSTAMGTNTAASANFSTAMGINTTASGISSTAMGNKTIASGNVSTAMGNNTNASGDNSTSMGNNTKSKSYGGLAVGLYNDSTNAPSATNFNTLNRIFQIGNGTADGARSNAMTVLQNGNVGIGTTDPNYMLTVKNDIDLDNSDANAGTIANALKFGGGNTGEAIGSNRTTATNQFGLDFYTNSVNRLAISLGGNIGIGTTGPTAKLSVNGSANNATGTWGVFSDARVKTITSNFTDGLNVIRQINPVIFNYNDNAPFKTSDAQIGIVAQELEKIAPYMVSKQAYNQFTDLREVNNQAYVFLLINAVKEQQQQIDRLEKLVTELSKKKN